MVWYYRGILEELGFESKPYDKCVAKKLMNGKQRTITWYVDDTKISHENENVTKERIKKLDKKLGKFKITRGQKYIFLGMHIT